MGEHKRNPTAQHFSNNPPINPEDLPRQTCKCGCKFFRQVFELIRVPAFMTKTGKDEMVPQPQMMCCACYDQVILEGVKKIEIV